MDDKVGAKNNQEITSMHERCGMDYGCGAGAAGCCSAEKKEEAATSHQIDANSWIRVQMNRLFLLRCFSSRFMMILL